MQFSCHIYSFTEASVNDTTYLDYTLKIQCPTVEEEGVPVLQHDSALPLYNNTVHSVLRVRFVGCWTRQETQSLAL